ncbi:MAG: hypothetical protein CVT72_03705 [Alphaproteobacteria bacterium HGW-Alphaproteobacteria-11]|nr:MAG: hypothetical protein CVT72_03705 [Alphaproteobacteria bacterium HGW-Alphaproteobacteria-11]
MCFNKSKSSSAQTQQTTTRDERIAADNGSMVARAEGGDVNVTIYDTSTEALVAGFGFAENVSASVLDGIFDWARDIVGFAETSSRQSIDFAASTQAAFQQAAQAAATEDATEIVQQFIQYAAIAMIAFFAFNYLQKAA